MIGDWVLTLNPTHKEKVFAQIDAIEEGQTCILVKRENVNWFVDIDWVEPIPLTPEILKKNDISLSLGPGGLYQGTVEGLNCNIEFNVVHWVHELQHAFWLCQTNKEIEL